MKRTPLYEDHVKLGGKMVPFAGWELPVQYSGVIAEHQAVRTRAGLFDVSHMGEVFVTGPEAEAAIDAMTCNAVRKLTDGRAHYSAILNERGGVVDDIIVYRYSAERYLICVNASNADKDVEWFTSHNTYRATFENRSAEFAQIAVQGPAAIDVVTSLPGGAEARSLKYFSFGDFSILGIPVIVARTGYTGEDGVEIFVPAESASAMWNGLLEAGASRGVVPCGLGARDSLRLEACYPLHGHELGEEISALESGLGWIVKFDKGEFIGRDALLAQKNAGVPRTLVGFFAIDQGIVRENEKIFDEQGSEIGFTTSGTKTPTVGKALGMALVKASYGSIGTKIFPEVRGRRIACEVVEKPFYKRA